MGDAPIVSTPTNATQVILFAVSYYLSEILQQCARVACVVVGLGGGAESIGGEQADVLRVPGRQSGHDPGGATVSGQQYDSLCHLRSGAREVYQDANCAQGSATQARDGLPQGSEFRLTAFKKSTFYIANKVLVLFHK